VWSCAQQRFQHKNCYTRTVVFELSIAFSLVIALVATTPILLVMRESIELPFVAFISSLALLLGASRITPAELERLATTAGRVKLLLAVPAAWVAVQLLPLPLSLSNPIWASAAAAMPGLSFGHVTMNVADTLRALGIYCGWLIVVLAAMVTTADRRRAEFCLAALVLATIVIAIVGTALSVLPNMMMIDARHGAAPAAAAALGCVLCLAAIQRLIERRPTRRSSADGARTSVVLLTILNMAALAICLTAMVHLSSSAWITALLGAMTVAAAALVSRFEPLRDGHRVIAAAIVTATVALAGTIVLLARSALASAESTLIGLASMESEEAISVAERTMKDATWFGSGAGTYGALLPVYEKLDQPLQTSAPSLAIKLTIEWGPSAPAALTLCALVLASILIGAAMRRGRDSFYASAGAGCLIGLTYQSYFDASLLNPAVGLLTAVIVGLALAQATGRTAGS
jgi:hypothetical protein